MTSPDTEATRELVSRTSAGGLEAVLVTLHDDLVLDEPPFLPYGGIHHGRDGFLAVMKGASALLDLPSVRVESVVADGERAVRIMSLRLLDSGAPVRIAEEITVRDGKIATIRVYWFDPEPLLAVLAQRRATATSTT
ncbi:nuclear transport factor 2 family protein [Jatrophihabitans fulvus]